MTADELAGRSTRSLFYPASTAAVPPRDGDRPLRGLAYAFKRSRSDEVRATLTNTRADLRIWALQRGQEIPTRKGIALEKLPELVAAVEALTREAERGP